MAATLPMCVVDYMDTTKSPEEEEIAAAIRAVRARLGDKVLILGHHYQRDGIVEHADYIGDSFMLSRKAADSDATTIVFCGVHFMAESAVVLTRDEQAVLMPTLRAGCSMADMATLALSGRLSAKIQHTGAQQRSVRACGRQPRPNAPKITL